MASTDRKQTGASRNSAHASHPVTTKHPVLEENGRQRTPARRVSFESAPALPISAEERAESNEACINFTHIRDLCENDSRECDIDLGPAQFAGHRRKNWPHDDFGPHHPVLSKIYIAVRDTGIPNALGARIVLPTKLNIPAWEEVLKGYDDTLLDYIKFGFPMGYIGPVSDSSDTPNHPSATQYVSQVDSFVEKELSLGGLVGPFGTPPFNEWTHVSPIMTRPKADPANRRIITDLTFPRQTSVNAYIRKNTVMGLANSHSLPTVDSVVDRVVAIGPGAFMFTIDVSRAYKNFKSCPLDWPLLAIRWRDDYYLDVTMPFGARASSGHMQRVADAIVATLASKGVTAHMYLDDLVVVAPSLTIAMAQYDMARGLLARLGLPEAMDKSQPPATSIKWLGINIDSVAGTMSVPHDKLEQLVSLAKAAVRRRSVTRKQLQSILGKMLHVAKCIKPARLFVARLLDELRGPRRLFINLNSSMKADIKWFIEFASQWNGVAIFPNPQLVREIVVDACLTGIGAATHQSAYAAQIEYPQNTAPNITEIEAINVAVALQTFVGPADTGKCIRVLCDNLPAVAVFQSGRGKNPVVLEAARLAWMVQAIFQVSIVYDHIPGRLNVLADALSRSHLSENHRNSADINVHALGLRWVEPCLHSLNALHLSSSNRTEAAGTITGGNDQTGPIEGPRNEQKSSLSNQGICHILPQLLLAPPGVDVSTRVCLHRAPERNEPGPADCAKSCRSYTRVPTIGRSTPNCQPPKSRQSPGGNHEAEGLQENRPPTPGCAPDISRATGPSHIKGTRLCKGSDPHDLLWRLQARRGGPSVSGGVRPSQTPDKGRR